MPNDTSKVNQLNNIGWQYLISDRSDNAAAYLEEALAIARKLNFVKGEAEALNNIGILHQSQSNYALAFDHYLQSLKKFEESGDKRGIAFANQSVGVIYFIQGNFNEAINYYEKAITIYDEIGDKRGIARSIANIADCYKENGDLYSSLMSYQRCFEIYSELNNSSGKCIALISIGEVYRNLDEYDLSLENYNRALKLAEEVGSVGKIISTLIGRSSTKIQTKDYSGARLDLSNSLALSKNIQSLSNYSAIYKNLSILDSLDEKWESAYINHQAYIRYRDRLINNESSKKTIKAQMELSYDQQKEINKAIQEKKDIKQKFIRNIIGGGLIASMIFGFVVARQRNRTAKEKQRSESLLLNILPAEIAEELKESGKAEARDFEMVSVLFTDFVEFTQTAEKLSAKDLVAEINECFSAFDVIAEKYHIEKIKTIGDAYMAAGGLSKPVNSVSSVRDTVLAAIEMQEYISNRKIERDKKGLPAFQMRAGIHTGSVVAGIVGLKKFQYDIWGDAVNTASRLESGGSVNKVNISKETFEVIKEDPSLDFEYRGKIQAKGKGDIDMWFVKKRQTA